MYITIVHYWLALKTSCDNISRMDLAEILNLIRWIAINTVVAIAIIYLLILIVDISFVGSFSSIMKHHAHDLTVILTNKKDNLVKLADFLTAKGVKLDKKKVDNLNSFDIKRIEIHDGEDAKLAREELTSLNDYFLSVCETGDILDKHGEYQRIVENINELEKVYRDHLMMYNADVLGYNFWIAFLPTCYIYKILKFKRKETI